MKKYTQNNSKLTRSININENINDIIILLTKLKSDIKKNNIVKIIESIQNKLILYPNKISTHQKNNCTNINYHTQNKIINISNFLKIKFHQIKQVLFDENLFIEEKITKNLYININPITLDIIINQLINRIVTKIYYSGKITFNLISNNKNEIDLIINYQKNKISNQKISLKNKILLTSFFNNDNNYCIKKILTKINEKTILDTSNNKIQIKFPKYKLTNNTVKIYYNSSSYLINQKGSIILQSIFSENKKNIFIYEPNNIKMVFLHNSLQHLYNIFYTTNINNLDEKLEQCPKVQLLMLSININTIDKNIFNTNLINQLKQKGIPIIIRTEKYQDKEKIFFLKNGAIDCIPFFFNEEELQAKIQSIINIQEQYKKNIEQSIQNKLISFLKSDINKTNNILNNIKLDNYNISLREKDVISLLKKGKLYKEISDELNIAIGTVRKHIQSIYRKCGVQNKIELFNKLTR